MKSDYNDNPSTATVGSASAHISTSSNLAYNLSMEEWLAVSKDLKGAEVRLLYHIRTLDPLGDRRIKFSVQDVAKTLKCSPGTISRALRVLDQKGYIKADKYFTLQDHDDPERRVRDQLQQTLGGLAEVTTAVGRIDLLTDTDVIEVKRVDDWKSALGQVLAYGAFYPEHRKRIHLFGKVSALKTLTIQSTCSDLGVVATFGGEA